MREVGAKPWHEVAHEHLSGEEDAPIGVDPSLLPLGSMKAKTKFWTEKGSPCHWKEIEENLIDELWPDQPEWATEHVQVHSVTYTGRSVAQNTAEVMEKVEEAKGDSILITALDEIAWITNLRGKDIDYNPLFFSYAVVHKVDGLNRIQLYSNPVKFEEVQDYLEEQRIDVAPYDQVFTDLSTGKFKDHKIVIDEN